MAKLDLTLACWDYDRVRALKDGSVRPEDIELKILTARPVQIFDRMLATQEFHVSEMGLASYVTLKARDRCPFAAIPVFISRMFRHGGIFVNTDAGIETPQDLKGKRVGLSRYVSTTAVFVRGMLQHDYGVRPRDVHWISGSQEEDQKNRPRQRDRDLPLDIRLDPVPEGKSLSGMLEAGELDAPVGYPFALEFPERIIQGEAPLPRLQRGGAGLLPPNPYFPHYAHGGDQGRCVQGASLGGS